MDTKLLRPPLLVGIKDAAGLLGICGRSVQNLIAAKQLTARKIGRRTLISYAELETFSKRGHRTAAGPERAQSGGAQ